MRSAMFLLGYITMIRIEKEDMMRAKKGHMMRTKGGALLTLVLMVLMMVYVLDRSKREYTFKQIESFTHVPWHEFGNKDTLVLFDVDNVLVSPHDMLARDETSVFFEKFRNILRDRDPQLCDDDEQFLCHLGRLLAGTERHIIEPDIGDKIRALREQGATVMAMTALFRCGPVSYLPQHRHNLLASHGIEFTQHHGDREFESLDLDDGTPPRMYKGILFGKAKGNILNAFLDEHGLKPRQIVFFDDKEHNLKTIADVCQQRAIEATLYHYVGHRKIPGDWNEERAHKQVEILVTQGKWLSDAEVDALLESVRSA